ncbi:MAG: hypothetical protein V1659_03055 [Candidatus Woesearchaeota archaeon]
MIRLFRKKKEIGEVLGEDEKTAEQFSVEELKKLIQQERCSLRASGSELTYSTSVTGQFWGTYTMIDIQKVYNKDFYTLQLRVIGGPTLAEHRVTDPSFKEFYDQLRRKADEQNKKKEAEIKAETVHFLRRLLR